MNTLNLKSIWVSCECFSTKSGEIHCWDRDAGTGYAPAFENSSIELCARQCVVHMCMCIAHCATQILQMCNTCVRMWFAWVSSSCTGTVVLQSYSATKCWASELRFNNLKSQYLERKKTALIWWARLPQASPTPPPPAAAPSPLMWRTGASASITGSK